MAGRRWLLLVLGMLLLYVIPSMFLQGVYGDSYGFLSGEDCWVPDGKGGWKMHGFPDDPRPDYESQDVPSFLRLMPVVLPALLLLLFILSPLARFVDKEPDFTLNKYESEKYKQGFDESTDGGDSPG